MVGEEDNRVVEEEGDAREEVQDIKVHKAVEITVETGDLSSDRVVSDHRQAEEGVLAVRGIPAEDQQGLDSIQLHRNNDRVNSLETRTCHQRTTLKCPLHDQAGMEISAPNRDTITRRIQE